MVGPQERRRHVHTRRRKNLNAHVTKRVLTTSGEMRYEEFE
jgi:hypothetical protein